MQGEQFKLKFRALCHLLYIYHLQYILSQGDSGGPLTVQNQEGAHTLIGVVSKMLPLDTTCKDQEYAVFTSISGFLPWIKSSIKDNGGMASCDASFSVPPSKGCSNYSIKNSYNKLNKKRQAFCRKISGASNSAWTSRPWRSIQRGATLLC